MLSSKVYAAGSKVVVAANELATDKGGVGTGWNTKPDGSGTSYYGGEELTLDADTILYATWALPVRVLDSTEAAQAIEELEDDESVKIEIEGAVDFEKLKTALASTKGSVDLDLSQADGFTSIGSSAFQNAAGLTSLVLPGTVISIGSNAFADSGLTSLIIRDDASNITIQADAIPEEAIILVPEESLEECRNKNPTLKEKIFPSTVTITVSWTGAGTSGESFKSEYVGDYGTPTGIPQKPETPANFEFKGWVDNTGKTVILPATFEETKEIQANATFVNTAGHPVYPAYLTVQHTSYANAQNDDVGQDKPSWADKIYSQQLVKRPISDPHFSDVFKFGDGSKQTPERSNFTVTAGDTNSYGSFRIPALTSIEVPSVGRRIFAAMDMRYRGRGDGNGDCGTTNGGSDLLIMYSDDGGATWTKKVIDVKNTYDEFGNINGMDYPTDLGDPSLWTIGNTVYVGAVGGGGIAGSNPKKSTARVFKSMDYGVTWEEDTNISSSRETYMFLWNDKNGTLINKDINSQSNLPNPGHGFTLSFDVPGTEMKKGMTVVPMQGGTYTKLGVYLAYGAGEPHTWGTRGSNSIGGNASEMQACQLDDGSILGSYKPGSGGQTIVRLYNGQWTSSLTTDPWHGRGASQSSLLKVIDGSDDSCGIVAFTSPQGSGAANYGNLNDMTSQGRDKVTVSFARDISRTVQNNSDSPLDTNRFYIQIRQKGMRYFGYTDMVMINNETMGLIYECFDSTDNLDGMRFISIDVSEIIKQLSRQEQTE